MPLLGVKKTSKTMKAKVKIGVRRYTFLYFLCKCRIYQSSSIREIFLSISQTCKVMRGRSHWLEKCRN